MQVKILSTRLRYDSLSVRTEQARFLQSEALNRAQSDICCEMTLALMGSSHGENRALKSNLAVSRTQLKNPDFTGDNSRHTILGVVARV